LLLQELQALPPPLTQTAADSVANAVGVELNRLQNISITLDKAKHCLNQPGQGRTAPLALLTDAEVAEHLWNGEKSVVKRAIRAASSVILEPSVGCVDETPSSNVTCSIACTIPGDHVLLLLLSLLWLVL
jgi:hypothetical protein